MMKGSVFGLGAAASLLLLSGYGDVSRFDERIAADRSQADRDGLVWVDGKDLPLESKAFADTPVPYGRLSSEWLPKCPVGIQQMSRQSTGHYFLFATDSGKLAVEWVLEEKAGRDPYIPPQGLYGVDLYDTVDGKWRFVRNGRLSALTNSINSVCVSMPGKGLRPVLVYLPTRGVVRSIRIGLQQGAKLVRWRHKSGIVRPVVHYGTSIVHGGCASRPGLCFTSIVGREVDAPYVNLGFSGCARLEPVMADVLAQIDASLYLVDPVWNCSPDLVRERLEPFLRKLHSARPEVTILMCEGGEPEGRRLPTNEAMKEVYDRLVAEESTLSARLRYLPAEGMIQTDGESTHDYCHPNDYGSVRMGEVFSKAVKACLPLPVVGATYLPGEGDFDVCVYQTTGQKPFRALPTSPFTIHAYTNRVPIDVDAATPCGRFQWLGVSMTDASCWLLSQLEPAKRRALLLAVALAGFDFTCERHASVAGIVLTLDSTHVERPFGWLRYALMSHSRSPVPTRRRSSPPTSDWTLRARTTRRLCARR